MNSVAIGQYIPGKSVIHKLNAVVKIVSFLIFLTAVVLAHTIPGYLIVIGITMGIIYLSGISWKRALASVKGMGVFFLVIFAMNTIFSTAEDTLWTWGLIHISYAGMLQGLNVVLRVILLMILGNILTSTTPPLEITTAMEQLMAPLRILRIPTQEIAMILSVAIQFIPTLFEEAEQIRKAQIARGAKFESSSFLERSTSVLPLVVPIFLSAFRRADELSMAMEARGYRRASKRTKKSIEHIHISDVTALGVSCTLCLAQILL